MVKKKTQVIRQKPMINPMFPDFVLVGVQEMDGYMVPVWRSRKNCKREARSRY